MVFLCRIHWYFGAFSGTRFGVFREGIKMNTLLAVLATVPAAEAIKMFSSGAMLAIAVFTAAKTGKRRR